MFPGNWTHNLLFCYRNALPLSHGNTLNNKIWNLVLCCLSWKGKFTQKWKFSLWKSVVITGYQHSSKYYFVFSRRKEFIKVWRLGQLEVAVNVDWIFIFGWAISLSHVMRYLVCEIHTFLAWISVQINYRLLYTDIITFSKLTHYQIFIGFILKGQLPSSNESDLGEDVALHYFLQQRTSGLTWSAENEARSVLLPVILLHRVQIHSAKKNAYAIVLISQHHHDSAEFTQVYCHKQVY